MKKVYSYDNNHFFTSFDYHNDDYEPKENQTTVAIPDGLYMPITFDPVSKSWTGLTLEEFENNNHTNVDNSPDANQLMLNQVISMLSAQQVTINAIQAQLETEK